ncbi:hypothetical protein E4U47_002882 [Claviceps purpurea]|nr:hypothetical protein E4U12_001599 [Claviceps purpurea]KAG6137691.1 hypothetical protein E4U38_000848 [Claviceps purpurea]KAG6139217.1 hypothetical protein E4U28_003936 [Claviceps purpurea]KAG6151141.1 hypothetical protein E4U37_005297 [Claviceps purpurea]KAG6166732.1 hypothetical protein E4U11_007909 [Claviceps purpurea]
MFRTLHPSKSILPAVLRPRTTRLSPANALAEYKRHIVSSQSRQTCHKGWLSNTARPLRHLQHKRPAELRLEKGAAPTNSDAHAENGLRPGQWSFEEMKELVAKTKGTNPPGMGVAIIDVRELYELEETGKIPGAIHIPLGRVEAFFHDLAHKHELSEEEALKSDELPARDMVFYCKAGVRAETAAQLARQMGFENVGVYHGSWLEWVREGGPAERL